MLQIFIKSSWPLLNVWNISEGSKIRKISVTMFKCSKINQELTSTRKKANLLDELKELNQQLHDFMNDIKKFILMSRNGKYILI